VGQRHATAIAVLGVHEDDMPTIEIDLAPMQPQRFTDASAGVQEEDHQGAKVIATGINQAIGFHNSERPHPASRRSKSNGAHHPRLAACFMMAETGV
jgi:hypothetical protein